MRTHYIISPPAAQGAHALCGRRGRWSRGTRDPTKHVRRLAKFRTDFMRIGVGPLVRECAAFVGLYRIDAAKVAVCEICARTVSTALEHQTSAVRSDFSFRRDEPLRIHAKKCGDSRHLRLGHAHNAVLDATTRPASAAMELFTPFDHFSMSLALVLSGLVRVRGSQTRATTPK